MERLKAMLNRYKPGIEEILNTFFDKKIRESGGGILEESYREAKRFTLSPGKRLRPLLVIAGYMGIKGEPSDDVKRVAASYEMLHAYLLTHDDIVDRDEVRRWEPTVWKSMADREGDTHTGISYAIFIGDVIRSLIGEMVSSTEISPEIKYEILKEISNIDEITNRGQIIDFYLSTIPLDEVEKDDIMKVYLYKTAIYTLSGPLSLGAILAGSEKDLYRDYAMPVGIAFQMVDDILGVFGDEEKTGKPVGSDIREGKKTLLVYYAYKNGNDADRRILSRYLGREDLTEEEITEVMDVIRGTGALDMVRNEARDLVSKGLEALEAIEIEESVKAALADLGEYILKRER